MGGVGGVIGAIVVGLILGVIGRLLVPGEQKIPWWLTILVGIGAAFLGNAIAGWLDVRYTGGFDWIRHALQVGVAVVGIILVDGIWVKAKAGSASR